jgi:hypothetical protein
VRTSLLSLVVVALAAAGWSGSRPARTRNRDVADAAFGESETLPPTDEVPGFLDLLTHLARMDP